MTSANSLKEDALYIIDRAIKSVMPDEAVKKTLCGLELNTGKVVLVSAGKAGWQMAMAAYEVLKDRIDKGVVITKYGHVRGPIGNFDMYEAGHPVPDNNSFIGTEAAIDAVKDLTENDTVLFLLSGGASALFEKPLIPEDDLKRLTNELLAKGADICSINTIRKRVSAVKGGKFAKICEPAKVVSVVLSDIIGDPLDMIASGPAYPDSSTAEEAKAIAEKYDLTLTEKMQGLLSAETPKEINNVVTYVNGSVRNLVEAAARACGKLGYDPVILTDCLECEAREAGSFLASIAKSHQNETKSVAYIAGGETVVHLTGDGKGGRNQEIALSAAIGIAGLKDTAVFSVGSDGTDGPTDAAGGFADGNTLCEAVQTEEARKALKNNDAYELLRKADGLIITGPTGTNVNDFSVVLIRRAEQ